MRKTWQNLVTLPRTWVDEGVTLGGGSGGGHGGAAPLRPFVSSSYLTCLLACLPANTHTVFCFCYALHRRFSHHLTATPCASRACTTSSTSWLWTAYHQLLCDRPALSYQALINLPSRFRKWVVRLIPACLSDLQMLLSVSRVWSSRQVVREGMEFA